MAEDLEISQLPLKISQLPLKTTISDYDVFTLLDSENDYLNSKTTTATIKEDLATSVKQVINTTATSPLILVENTCYKLGTITALTLSNYLDSPLETEIQFTTGESFAFTAPGYGSHWVGSVPTFESNKNYVIAIKNGVASYGELA